MSTDAETIAKAAKQAFEASQLISAEERVRALHEIRKELESSKTAILEANKVDLEVRLPLSTLFFYKSDLLTNYFHRFATPPYIHLLPRTSNITLSCIFDTCM